MISMDIVTEDFISPEKLADTLFSTFSKGVNNLTKVYANNLKEYNKNLSKYIVADEETILLFDGEFTISDFKVYNIKSTVPSTKPIQKWQNTYIKLCERFEYLTLEDLRRLKQELTSEANMGTIRANILKVSEPIDTIQFKELLPVTFGPINSDTTITINKNYVSNMMKNRPKKNIIYNDIYKEIMGINQMVSDIESLRKKMSRAIDINLQSSLVKTTMLSVNKRNRNLTKEQQVIAYNLDLLYLHMSRTILAYIVQALAVKMKYALEDIKQDMAIYTAIVNQS